MRSGTREVEFRVEVSKVAGKYSVTPSELLELKGRAAKLFTQAPPGSAAALEAEAAARAERQPQRPRGRRSPFA